ncbi:hypothetical protein MATL_G00002830 [Megalops atlanticus]|uniref:Uncharacterized protein n=1 Tax=Megalops atlanticus TaxID=7932 RepID=A0A9D3TDT3_MEGAT|nr:hypothetical protein MATL_G00002830 [Megalops atlanticus]
MSFILYFSELETGGSFVESSLRQERSTSTGLWGLGVVAPALAVSLLVTAGLVLVLLLCLIRKLRQAEGTYQPRREEETGSRGIETPDVLKLPKKERLI